MAGGRADLEDPQRCGGCVPHEQGIDQRGFRKAFAGDQSRRYGDRKEDAGHLHIPRRGDGLFAATGQERARLRRKSDVPGGTGQVAHPETDRLRTARPGNRPPHQTRTPGDRFADGRDLPRRRFGNVRRFRIIFFRYNKRGAHGDALLFVIL